MRRFKYILYFADGVPASDAALECAAGLARRNQARLALIDVFEAQESPPGITQQFGLDVNGLLQERRHDDLERLTQPDLEQLVDQTRFHHEESLDLLLRAYDMHRESPGVHLTKGEPAPSICAVAERTDADLIVMGTVGRTGIPGFFIGNAAEEVLQTAVASILAVKPEGFVSTATAD